VSFRATFASRKQNGKGLSVQAKDRVFGGADINVIEVDFGAVTEGKLSIKDFLEKMEWSKDFIAPGIQWLEYLDGLYERLTPLARFLSTGQGATQDRSAAATQVRDRNTMTRVEDMRDMIAEADNTVARKEAFLAGSKLTQADIAVTMPDAAQNWGFLTDANPQEARDPNYWMGKLTEGQPWLAADPQAQQQAMQLAAEAYTMSELIYQTEYEIEVSSSRRKDIDQQIDSLNGDSNTLWPIQLGSMDPRQMALAYDSMAIRSKLQGMDASIVQGQKDMAEQLRQQALAPPPVAPAPAQKPA